MLVLVVGALGPALAAPGNSGNTPNNPNSPEESPSPSPEPLPIETTAPDPEPDPDPEPPPAPLPAPAPSPTENCLATEQGAVSFGDVDRDCDGTLLLSEQGDPISLRRSLEVPPREASDTEGEAEDRFEPTDFVPGTLVDFDEVSEQGGTIREGSLIYTPRAGFTGEDRFTFLVRGDDDLLREAEVLITVREAEPAADEPSPQPRPRFESPVTEDAAQRVLAEAPLTTEARDRWDPSYLGWMILVAGLLVSLALAWWLFLEVRIQDRMRD